MSTLIGDLFARLRLDDQMTAALHKAAGIVEMHKDQWAGIGSQMTQAGGAITAGLTVPLVAAGAASLKTAIDFESAFAGVRKTVDATEPEFAALKQGFRDMAMEVPASTTAILGVGEAAGQLGIAKDDILDFTRTMVDLGETTNLTADEAATATAQIQNIFGAAGVDVDRFGATLVALGNSGASTEKDIISMGLRIAGAATQVGMSQAETLAFASALSSVGIEAEAGGTAISRTFLTINDAVMGGGDALDEFARIAGMSASQYKAAFEADAAGATNAFIGGLARIKGEGENVSEVLGNLELGEIRVRDALMRASGASDMVTDSLKLGKDAWAENSALTDEARKRYETTEAKLGILWNKVKDVGVTLGESFIPMLLGVVDAMEPVVSVAAGAAEMFGGLPMPLKLAAVGFAGILAAIGPVILIGGQLITAGTAIGGVLVTLTGATSGWAAAAGILTPILGALPPVLAVVATGIAAVSFGTWIGEIPAVTDLMSGLIARVGEFIGLLPEGTTKQLALTNAIINGLPSVKEATTGFTLHNDAAKIAAGGMAVFEQSLQPVVSKSDKLTAELRKQDEAFKALSPSIKSQIAEALRLGGSNEEVAAAFSVSEASIAKFDKTLKDSTATADKASEAYKRLVTQLQGTDAAAAGTQLVAAITATGGALRLTKDEAEKYAGQLADIVEKSEAMGQKTPPHVLAMAIALDGMATSATDAAMGMQLLGQNIDAVTMKAPAIAAAGINMAAFLEPFKTGAAGLGQSLGDQFKGALGNAMKGLPKVMLGAMQGGGDVGKSVGAHLGGSLGEWAGKAAGPALGKMLGKGLGGAVGTMFGPVGTMIGGFLGDKVGGLFGKLTGGLFGGNKEKKEVEGMRAQFIAASGGIEVLRAKAAAAGVSIDAMLKASKVEDFKNAVDSLNMGLEQKAMNLQLAKQAAEEFGIPAERMGQAFKQAEADLSSGDMLAKLNALIDSGVDMATVIEFAGDDVGKLVHRAIEMGTSVPLEFKKIAAAMIEQGTLVDANGDKFTELSQIPFATDMQAQFSGLIDKLDEFLDKLAGIPSVINFEINGQVNIGDGPGLTPMAEGGLVTGPTPILAGEAGPEAIIPLSKLGSFQNGSDATLDEIRDMNANLRRIIAQQPALIAKALRDAMRGAAIGRG